VEIVGYVDLRPIGRGGFGVVYRARDRRFAREVAIKVLNGVLDETAAARFERECHAVGALSGHPHIVVVHDSGTTPDGQAYLVMELLGGGSLAAKLAGDGPQSWRMAVELGVQLAGALETAHRGGVLHRDVKPENVLFSMYGQAKLVDFGIATISGGFETKTAGISASLAHAAPEILSGRRSSPASDVYALGSTLFEVLAGHPAFVRPDDETLFPLLSRIARDPVPDLRPLGVPDDVALVIEKAMSKAPEDRYPQALALAVALQQASTRYGGMPVNPVVLGVAAEREPADSAAPPTSHQSPMPLLLAPPAPRRRRRTALVAAAAVVLAAGGVGYGLSARGGGATVLTAAADYLFTVGADANVAASRVWRLDRSARVLTSDTTVTNLTTRPVVRQELELIPASVAADLNDLTFVPASQDFVSTRVVRWKTSLPARAVQHYTWTTTLSAPLSKQALRDLAKQQSIETGREGPALRALGARVGQSAGALVPFPTAGELSAVAAPAATALPPAPTVAPVPTTVATSAGTPAVTRTAPSTSRTTSPPIVGSGPGTPANAAPTLAAVGDLKVDEQQAARITFSGTDPDGDALTYSLSGTLPPGLSRSGGVVTGTVRPEAASVTQTYGRILTRTFSLSVTAHDGHGHSSAPRSFQVIVRDTYLASLPSYIGHFGCRGSGQNCPGESGLPGLAQLSPSPGFSCYTGGGGESGSIQHQGTPPGTAVRWGANLSWTFYSTAAGSCG
jgi:hypothetical protein